MIAPVLSANDLRLAFGSQHLLEGVTLAIGASEKMGLVGRNGCGKTSLLKILGGSGAADSGQITFRRGLRVGYLPQEFELAESATVRESIAEGAADILGWIRSYEAGTGSENELAELLHRIEAADGWNLDARIRALAGALAAPPLEAQIGPLSGGEKRRVALCRALAGRPDLLLLDEPTNHLDADTIRWLEGFLREFPGAVIFVTHDRYFLDVIATRIVELAGGRCFSHPGNYTAYLEARATRKRVAEQTDRRRQRFLQVELEWVRAGVRAQRSKSRRRLEGFYQVEGLEAPPEEREMDLLIPPALELGNIAVELCAAGAQAGEGPDARWLFRALDLVIRPGECTGIVGRNGAGKTTLLRLCMGVRPPDGGHVAIAKKAAFNYIDQGRMQLDGARTVMAEIADSGEAVRFGEQTLSVRGYLRRFLFDESRVNERVDMLSGGERARLMLAKVLKRGGNVLVLDEPTNDLDLGSLRMLEEALLHFEGAVLVVSHDRYFLDRICDRIVAFEETGVFVQPGNYSYYLEKRVEREALARTKAAGYLSGPAHAPENLAPRPSRERKLTYKERGELDGMETAILAAETRAAEIEKLLNDPVFFVGHSAEAPGLIAEMETQKTEVAQLYARWEELERLR